MSFPARIPTTVRVIWKSTSKSKRRDSLVSLCLAMISEKQTRLSEGRSRCIPRGSDAQCCLPLLFVHRVSFSPRVSRRLHVCHTKEDPDRCWTYFRALASGCKNAPYPDRYGHYREVSVVQIKHHWWWKVSETRGQTLWCLVTIRHLFS